MVPFWPFSATTGPLCIICVYQTKHYHLIRVTCSFPSNLSFERAESIIEYIVSSIWDHSIRNGGVKRQVFLSAKINGVEITVPIFILQSSSFRKIEKKSTIYIASIQTHSKKMGSHNYPFRPFISIWKLLICLWGMLLVAVLGGLNDADAAGVFFLSKNQLMLYLLNY